MIKIRPSKLTAGTVETDSKEQFERFAPINDIGRTWIYY